jgi:hypothetical protein
VDVGDLCAVERCRERIGVKLRIAAGFGNGADVDELRDFVGLQLFEEMIDGSASASQLTSQRIGCVRGAFRTGDLQDKKAPFP